MLEDIKKILELSKRGIVVVENGKPSYVIVPFEDYSGKPTAIGEKKASYLLNEKNKIESIEDLIEKELQETRTRMNDEYDGEDELREIFKKETEVESIKKDLKEIRLEDLPF